MISGRAEVLPVLVAILYRVLGKTHTQTMHRAKSGSAPPGHDIAFYGFLSACSLDPQLIEMA